ncbi:beta-defensin 125 [Oryctolagus cuniculus]|uniref:beta-defensin 125 n=1 Tax=Oryctolagus cuniculus TaxID=9986 RepID=UPI003879F17C
MLGQSRPPLRALPRTAAWIPQHTERPLPEAMGRLMLTLVLCALLAQVTEGSWGIKRCWKNDVGHCRRRCLDDERYIRLCRNKLSCCISLTLSYDITRRPPPPVINIEDFTDSFDEDQFSASPVSRLSDEVTFFGTPETRAPTSQTVTTEHTTPGVLANSAGSGSSLQGANATSAIPRGRLHWRQDNHGDG